MQILNNFFFQIKPSQEDLQWRVAPAYSDIDGLRIAARLRSPISRGDHGDEYGRGIDQINSIH